MQKRRLAEMLLLTALLGLLLTSCNKRDTEDVAWVEETPPITEATFFTVAETEPPMEEPPETEPPEEHYVISFAGDCTFGGTEALSTAGLGFPKTVGEDYGYPLRNVQCYFAQDDLTLVNLEGPLTDTGYPTPGKAFNFKGSTAYTQILTQGSVEAVGFSNNHVRDYGEKGYQSTLDALDAAGIPYVTQDSWRILTLGEDFRVGIFAGMFYTNPDKVVAGVEELKTQDVDFIIVAVHWGTENSYTPIVGNQIDIAHAAIDAGADVVWGHHPHVLQPIEEYGSGIIFYSMGNFSFGGNTMPRDFDSAVIQLRLVRTPDGTVTREATDVYPVCISSDPKTNNYQPTPYVPNSEEYIRVLEKLNWSNPNS